MIAIFPYVHTKMSRTSPVFVSLQLSHYLWQKWPSSQIISVFEMRRNKVSYVLWLLVSIVLLFARILLNFVTCAHPPLPPPFFFMCVKQQWVLNVCLGGLPCTLRSLHLSRDFDFRGSQFTATASLQLIGCLTSLDSVWCLLTLCLSCLCFTCCSEPSRQQIQHRDPQVLFTSPNKSSLKLFGLQLFFCQARFKSFLKGC